MSDLVTVARLGNYPACEKLLSAKVKKTGIKFPRYVSNYQLYRMEQNEYEYILKNEYNFDLFGKKQIISNSMQRFNLDNKMREKKYFGLPYFFKYILYSSKCNKITQSCIICCFTDESEN